LVPRYGPDVVGGTEHWVRTLAEHLVARLDWQVEVFTTGAVDASTWADELPPGSTNVNGVLVHRFASVSGRDAQYLRLLPLIEHDPAGTPDELAYHFVHLVGPVCPDAVAAAASSANDLIAVTPYLFWPAVHGTPRLGRRVIFHGAAHDEPELHLPIMRHVFDSVGGFAFNSHAERALVEATFPVAHLPGDVIGNAVVAQTGDTRLARAALGLGADERFVLCVGRVERSKGTHVLADMWRLYRGRRPDAPRLVVLGPVHDPLVGDDDVTVAGPQSEQVKWGALAASDVVINPSGLESFSLVVLESWLAGTPVIVNGRCEATVEHCRRGGGGFWFAGYGDFEVLMDRLLADEDERDALAHRGARYAREQFGWDAILNRYARLAQRIVEARCPSPGRSPG
jgi:glycosyltransferase involved in cell wall biosynthesis